MTYTFKSLNELAAYLEGKAVDIRNNSYRSEQTRREYNARASTLEEVAHVLRNTIIKESPNA